MRAYKIFILLMTLFCCSCHDEASYGRHDNTEQSKKSNYQIGNNNEQSNHTNYGYNIVVVADLSNRIMNNRLYDDPQILELITSKLKNLFQKSADVGINGKFFFTTVNSLDLTRFPHNDSIFKIDLTRFKTNVTLRSDYLHHNTGSNSLQHDISVFNSEFKKIYTDLKRERQLPADMWYFLKDKLTYPIIDTSSSSFLYKEATIKNKYKNYIIILTDGYIEAGRYGDNKDMKEDNKLRFLSEASINTFRNEFKSSKLRSVEDFFTRNNNGIIPVKNCFLEDCKLLVLELFDRSVKNGVNTQTPTDFDIMNLFWNDWLLNSNVSTGNLFIYPTFTNKQDLDQVISKFLDIQ